ncbi:MAG: glutamine--tRNA ligase/YqeY domain fusion protein [Bacillota bacterium]|mgnify:CR=1 FL=1|jgi:glutaminyl-tRNA synthetase|nr:glutamine--tRNA ligase/YqeY domain fusion protein [Bacillota bacterium]HHU43831.1 glutamine--tRNA ligase/YqeY domain fusion protein [Clostridiales bacterium]
MEATNFIENIINKDLESGKVKSVYTRFPPEPNGYLHIGHAKSLCINFGIKEKYNGKCNLRYDDTNPVKEEVEYVDAIREDIKWLGFVWDEERYASDYFEQFYEYAVMLIKKGLAYVCDLSAEEIREIRGTLTEPGKESPYRNRSVEENLRLFQEMREGKYADGEKVLRAKIDMASSNMNMRDPVMYRILRAEHHRTGDKWLIYPMYDFAHPLEDAIENITHSICTLEFEDHRPLYDWFVEHCEFENPPQQIEFARLEITNTVMSKRYLKRLVDQGLVDGWDDPRMPTLSGMRKRGYPPEAIKNFCQKVGVAKANSVVDHRLLEFCVRDYLNTNAPRAMMVEKPLKIIIDNWEEGRFETIEIPDYPQNEDSATHKVRFGKEIFIDRRDFSLNPPPKYHRLVVGGKIRLKGAYILEYASVDKDENGEVVAVHCNYIEDSRSGQKNSKIKVKSTVQWVNCEDALPCELYKYSSLFLEQEDADENWEERINPNSLEIVKDAVVEPFLADQEIGKSFQFMREAYYKLAGKGENGLKFYRIVELKDSFKL